jgi:hypothetical protein
MVQFWSTNKLENFESVHVRFAACLLFFSTSSGMESTITALSAQRQHSLDNVLLHLKCSEMAHLYTTSCVGSNRVRSNVASSKG